ncbi:MAG: family 10 glycosylhydrolase [Thermoplasmatota archaeon]
MRGWTRSLLIFIMVLPSLAVLDENVWASDDLAVNGQTILDYPQQDGGRDDRLFQYRSMWMDGYQIVNISEVRAAVAFAREHGFNCLSPNINGHSLGVFYDSRYFPKYPEVHWSFDPLMELIREAHKYNIHVMPWFHTLYNYPALRDHPEWRDRSSSGSNSSVWMDPANPEVRGFLANLTRELFENYPLDGIKLDTIRYGGSNMGYTDISIQKYYDEGWSNFNDFRRNQVTEVVGILYDTVMDIRPWSWVGADIWHAYSSWYNYVFQDSRTWANRGIIDFVTTMSYTTSVSTFTYYLDDNLRNFDCEVVAGPYVYVPGNTAHGSVPNEETGISIMLQQTEATVQMGSLGTCMFAYKFLRDFPAYARALRDGPFSEPALCPLKKQRFPVERRFWGFENDHDTEGWRTTGMGQFFPIEGKWSVVDVNRPGFMSPLMSFNANQINVVEIMMKSEARAGNISVHWSFARTDFNDGDPVRVNISGTGEWNLYSIHMDASPAWNGGIGYLKIVPWFPKGTNITIDWIRITWMPYCIRDWAYIGPFHSGDSETLLEREFIPDQESVLPRLGDVMGGREWKPFSMDRDLIDLGFVIDQVKDSVTYSHVYVRSEREEVVELRHGNSDGARIWLNGKEVFSRAGSRSVSPDQDITYVVLKRGLNTLLLKQAVFGDENSFFMRFTSVKNETLDWLEYSSEVRPLDPPTIIWSSDEWSNETSPRIEWSPPGDSLGLDHYEYVLNGSEPVGIEDDFLQLEGLHNGIHTIQVRCVDDLGFKSEWSEAVIRTDAEVPLVSIPRTDKPHTRENSIKWEWEVLVEPASGIVSQFAQVSRARYGSQERKVVEKDIPVTGSGFLYRADLWNGYEYYLSVRAVSGSGLEYITPVSQGVLVDTTPPTRPADIAIEQIEYGSRQYLISWTVSVENIKNGLDHYEVWMQRGGGPWELFAMTEENEMVLERPLGTSISVKVRARDRTSLYSTFTDVVHTVNMAPRPQIVFPGEITEGMPVEIGTGKFMDPDGKIILQRWFVNGEFVSKEGSFSLTFGKGTYKISLRVIDDQGEQVEVSRVLEVKPGAGSDPESSMSQWLESTSEYDRTMKPVQVPIYNNRTVPIVRDDTGGENGIRQYVADGFMVVAAIALIVLVAVLVFFVITGEALDRRVPNAEDEQKEPSASPMEQRRKMVESLYTRAMMQRMAERNQGARVRIAPSISPAQMLHTPHGPITQYITPTERKRNESYEEWDAVEEWEVDD